MGPSLRPRCARSNTFQTHLSRFHGNDESKIRGAARGRPLDTGLRRYDESKGAKTRQKAKAKAKAKPDARQSGPAAITFKQNRPYKQTVANRALIPITTR
jgi:hypothetical protein